MISKQKNRAWRVELTELTYSIDIGKTYQVENGLVATSTDGNGFDGRFRTVSLFSVADICALQDRLTSHQCLIAGTSTVDAEFGRLGKYTDGYHERTKEWFPEPWCHALVTCDIDRTGAPQALQTYMGSAADVARLFFEVVPQIRGASLLVRPSSSNGVCHPDGNLAKAGGWHVHLIAPPGMRVAIMERLYAAFARAGFGWIMVSAFPALLKRNPVDTALLIPNQPIYSGLPRVRAPVILNRPACFVQEGCAFDPDWLPNEGRVDVEHIYDELKKAPEVQTQEEAVIDRKAEAEVPASTPNRSTVVSEVKVKIRKQIEEGARGFLFGDFPITLYNGPTVTVAQILARPYYYHRSLTLTPGEEDYRDGAQTGIVYVSESGVRLHTQAHGGITYTLLAFDPDMISRNLIGEQKPEGPLPPEEAKWQLRSTLATWPHETRSLAVKATQGLGKTREVLKRMADKTEIRFLFLAANLKQCQQVYDEFCALYNGVDAALCRGRSAPDPETEGAAMCTQPARCEIALACGATSLSTSACLKCPHFDTCGYQKQAKRFGREKTAPRIIFAAHDYAHYSLPGGWAPDALVLDEVLRTGGVDEEINTPAADMTLQEKLDPANALVAHSMSGSVLDWTDPAAIKAHRYKCEVLQAMASGAPHYAINDRWVVPKYREFAHDDIPVLVIDGTLRQDLLELQLRRKFEVVQIEARRNVILIQVVGNDAGSGATTTAFTKGTSEPVKRYLSNLPRDWCLFTYKAVRNALQRDDDPACGHFSGDIRGSNRFKAYQTSLIYGRLQIPEAVAVGRARVLAEANGLPAPSGKMEWIEREVQTTYAGRKKVKYLRHTDPLVQSIIESEREDEVEQAIDRLRLVWHNGEPKVVFVVNNLPPTVEPMFVLCWEDVREERAAPPAMHATLTGLIPASGEQGPALRPDLWRGCSTASRHMKDQLRPNWKEWFMRLMVLPADTGKRRQAVEAYYRPADCDYTAEYKRLLMALGANSPHLPY
jgi:hypothetical protein